MLVSRTRLVVAGLIGVVFLGQSASADLIVGTSNNNGGNYYPFGTFGPGGSTATYSGEYQ